MHHHELTTGGGRRCWDRRPGDCERVSHRGVDVQVYEQARQLGEVGAGVALGSNSIRLLERLGLEGPLRDYGPRWTQWRFNAADGRVLTNQEMDGRVVGMYRPDLIAMLADSLRRAPCPRVNDLSDSGRTAIAPLWSSPTVAVQRPIWWSRPTVSIRCFSPTSWSPRPPCSPGASPTAARFRPIGSRTTRARCRTCGWATASISWSSPCVAELSSTPWASSPVMPRCVNHGRHPAILPPSQRSSPTGIRWCARSSVTWTPPSAGDCTTGSP